MCRAAWPPWEAGLEGFAARPVLGWGPENFGAVFGRFASGYGATAKPHDRAHNKLVEVAATTGGLGLAVWLALWTTAFVVLWRAARAMEARERALAVFAGGALFGTLVQSLSLFDTAIGLLQYMLLLGFVVSLEAAAVPEHRRPRMPAAMEHVVAALLRRGRARIALGVAAVALAATGARGESCHLERGRHRLSASAGRVVSGPGGRHRRLPATREYLALAAVRRARSALAAAADRGRGPRPGAARMGGARGGGSGPDRARPLADRAQLGPDVRRGGEDGSRIRGEGAANTWSAPGTSRPNRAVFSNVPESPGGLGVRELPDGRHELRWRWPEGAGYIVVTESRDGGRGRNVLHRYDPVRTSFVPPGPRSAGIWRYRIKACLYPGACSTVVEWPPIVVPAGGVDRGSEP